MTTRQQSTAWERKRSTLILSYQVSTSNSKGRWHRRRCWSASTLYVTGNILRWKFIRREISRIFFDGEMAEEDFCFRQTSANFHYRVFSFLPVSDEQQLRRLCGCSPCREERVSLCDATRKNIVDAFRRSAETARVQVWVDLHLKRSLKSDQLVVNES